jgi:chromosome segregation ATPase
MSEYTLKFEAKFADGDADLVARIAAILAEAKAEILRVENETLRAEVTRLTNRAEHAEKYACELHAELQQVRRDSYMLLQRSNEHHQEAIKARAELQQARQLLSKSPNFHGEHTAEFVEYVHNWEVARLNFLNPPTQESQ